LQHGHRTELRSPASDILDDGQSRWALFLDVDGTLLDIALTPDLVVVPPGLSELLVRISKGLGGAIAVLTGRQLGEIDALLAPARFVGGGVHGSELRTTPIGAITRVANELPPSLLRAVDQLALAMPGIIAEPKGPGLAVHYRLAPDLKDAVEARLRALLHDYAGSLVLCPGRKLFEVIPAGHSKGTALEIFAAMPTFAGRRPLMIGDDVGDEPALRAAERLGGTGLRVAGEHFGSTKCDFLGPKSVIEWLSRFADRIEA
jgi:trehalose 6-phosphate phosphatase